MGNVRFGIIGTGAMAEVHAQAIRAMAGGSLQAVLGRRPQAAQAFAARHGIRPCSNLDEFLASPDLDVVTIATPSGAHLEFVLAAAQAGKHVLVERPLEVTLERVDRMMEACQRAGVLLGGILSRRFCPAIDALKTAVVEGRFGTLTMADASVKWHRDPAFYDSGNWRGALALAGGGALMNEGFDAIDRLLYLAGDVRSVWASTARLTHANLEVEDTAVAMLEFRNGARGVIQSATSCWSGEGHPAEVHLCGESGSVFLVEDRFRVWTFLDQAPMDYDVRATLLLDDRSAEVAPGFAGHQSNFEEFAQALRENREPLVTAAEARRAVALVAGMYESARHGGRSVEW